MATCRNSAPMPLTPSPAVAGDAVRGPLDPDQALDVEVQQIARSRVLVADHGRQRFQIAHPAKLQPPQDAADGGRTELQLQCDPDPGPTLAAQRFDSGNQLIRRLARTAAGTAGSVVKPGPACETIAPDPLRRTLPAEPALGCRLAQAQPAFHYALR